MRVLNYLATIFCGVSLVAAAKHSAITREVLALVSNKTDLLTQALRDWNGDIFDAGNIQIQSDVLLNATQYGTKKITDESPRMGNAAALRIKRPSKKLLRKVKESVGLILDLKSNFTDIGLGGLVKANLENQRAASSDLNNAIVDKLKTRVARRIATKGGKKVDKIFENAIVEYDVEDPQ